jgi:hypothetical protein
MSRKLLLGAVPLGKHLFPDEPEERAARRVYHWINKNPPAITGVFRAGGMLAGYSDEVGLNRQPAPLKKPA